MSTAVAPPPATASVPTSSGHLPVSANGSSPPAPLWPNGVQIPFIGVTGEFGSGKTLFGLLIDPKSTVHFDFEKSAKTYESGLPFKRIDMPDVMLQKFPNGRYRPIDLFVAWRDILSTMPRDKFRVVVIDDVSSLEDGLVEYVRKNPAEFGYTTVQFAKAEGLLWGAVKSAYKAIMLSAGIECCVMVTHMRNQYVGNRPSGKREAKGKETVMELASLYVVLDRKPDPKTGRMPEKPVARKLKDRLSLFKMNSETGEYEPHPFLPQRIEDFTPARIRHYILNPANYDKPKRGELVIEEQMTEEERLQAQIHLAEQQKEAAQAQVAAQSAANEAAKIRLQAVQMQAGLTAAKDESGKFAADVEAKAAAAGQQAVTQDASEHPSAEATNVGPSESTEAAGADNANVSIDTEASAIQMVTQDQLADLKRLKDRLQIPLDQWKAILGKRNVTTALNLTFDQADHLAAALGRKSEDLDRQRQLDDWARGDAWAKGQVAKNLASGQQPLADTTETTTATTEGSAEQPPFDAPNAPTPAG